VSSLEIEIGHGARHDYRAESGENGRCLSGAPKRVEHTKPRTAPSPKDLIPKGLMRTAIRSLLGVEDEASSIPRRGARTP
jgi:hypothetical protein